ncbi:hypothetical protein D3C72_1313470 [compost metagenome]
MAGALGPLLHLLRAVVLRAQAAHRLLEQGEQGGDMLLPQGDDPGGRGVLCLRHGCYPAFADKVGACGRLALGKPATTRW